MPARRDPIRGGHFPTSAATRILIDGRQRADIVISGALVILYSKDAEANRAFFRDVLGFASVDAGHGWLIFALPPAEAAFHADSDSKTHELYLMCEDLNAEIKALTDKGVVCSEVQEQR